MKIGVHVLPRFPKDTTDRNRTSPFAFTGNKFEFRMPGSSVSISDANVVINTAVAESLKQYADILEAASDFKATLHDLIRGTIKKHKRIIFSGNGYDDAWIAEADRRGLSNLRTTPDALKHFLDEKNVALFTSHRVLSEAEIKARHEIMLESYCKIVNIEALTMLDMAKKQILPAVTAYAGQLASAAAAKRSVLASVDCTFEEHAISDLSDLSAKLYRETLALSDVLALAAKAPSPEAAADCYKNSVIGAMAALRATADALETITAAEYWPFPTYGALLFGII